MAMGGDQGHARCRTLENLNKCRFGASCPALYFDNDKREACVGLSFLHWCLAVTTLSNLIKHNLETLRLGLFTFYITIEETVDTSSWHFRYPMSRLLLT